MQVGALQPLQISQHELGICKISKMLIISELCEDIMKAIRKKGHNFSRQKAPAANDGYIKNVIL
jgi:hypothetical protein